MEIKQVKITRVDDKSKLLAYAIVDTDNIRIWDVKIIKRGEGRTIALPMKKKERNGVVTFHPYMRFNQDDWDIIKEAVLAEYDKENV